MGGPPAVGFEIPGLGGHVQRVGPVVVSVIPQDSPEDRIFPRESEDGFRIGQHIRIPLPAVFKPDGPFGDAIFPVKGTAQGYEKAVILLEDDFGDQPAAFPVFALIHAGKLTFRETVNDPAAAGKAEREGCGIVQDGPVPGGCLRILIGNLHWQVISISGVAGI